MNIIRRSQLLKKVGQSFSTIERLEKRGIFPRRIQLSPRSVGWSEEEVDDYLNLLPRGPLLEPSEATNQSLTTRHGGR